METDAIYTVEYYDVYEYPGQPLVGSPIFFPIYALTLADEGAVRRCRLTLSNPC
jgi:hypothetical protein